MSAAVLEFKRRPHPRPDNERELDKISRELGYSSFADLFDEDMAAWEAGEELKARELGYASLDDYLEALRVGGES
jgi:hypothetical protein